MREPRVSRGSSGSRLRQPKMSPSGKHQIQALTSSSSTPVPVSNNIHSYPFKNTVKLWAYKNNLEHIYTTSHCLFLFLKYKKVWCLTCFWGIRFIAKNKIKWFCELIITLEGGREREYAHIHIFKNRHHLPTVREHLMGLVWIKMLVHGHMSTHINTANARGFFWEIAWVKCFIVIKTLVLL